MKKDWNGKRYNNLNGFLREKFNGEKTYKISLDGGFTCPNRDGKVARGGCTFCSSSGSGDFAGDRVLSITKQFHDVKDMMQKKWKDGKYIAYFQAYTNTYAPVEELRKKYDEALKDENVVALAIATRPDCIGEDVLNLLDEYNKKLYTWVELGLQTSKDETAVRINRGYMRDTFTKAVKELADKGIDVVAHVIFGLPGETKEDMLNTVRYVSSLPIKGIKLHLLHVMENTAMAKELERGEFKLLEMDEYIDIITEAIAMLPQDIVIHRLTGDAPRDLLIGPKWSLKKWEVLNAIDDALKERDLYQGKYFKESEKN